MHKNKKIIICRFNLKNKCKFGEKCKFRHLNIDELNDILNKFEDLKHENKSLKTKLQEKMNLKSYTSKTQCDVTNDKSEKLKMPLYSSFFSQKTIKIDLKLPDATAEKSLSIIKLEKPLVNDANEMKSVKKIPEKSNHKFKINKYETDSELHDIVHHIIELNHQEKLLSKFESLDSDVKLTNERYNGLQSLVKNLTGHVSYLAGGMLELSKEIGTINDRL